MAGRPKGSKDSKQRFRKVKYNKDIPNVIASKHKGVPRSEDGKHVTLKPWALMAMLLYGTQQWIRRHAEGGVSFPVRAGCVALRVSAAQMKDYLYYLREMGIVTNIQLHPHFIYVHVNCPIGLMREITYVEKHHPTNITLDTARGGVRFLSDHRPTACEDSIARRLGQGEVVEGDRDVDAGGAGQAGPDTPWVDKEME